MATLKVNNETIVVDPTNLPAATTAAKGAVKKGAGVAKVTKPAAYLIAQRANAVIASLNESGALVHDKFVVQYMPNYTEDFDEDWYYDVYDNAVYSSGDTANVEFLFDGEPPHRSGYSFKGWALSPSAQTPDFPDDGDTYTVTFTNNDIALYAVWEAITCTLTYSLGEYGQGSVPSQQTAPQGSDVEIASSPLPTVNDGSGRVFIGWSTSDGGYKVEDVEYEAGDSVYLYDDITLYPVFAEQGGGGGDGLTIDNTNGEYAVVVWHLDENEEPVTDFTVTAGGNDTFTPTDGVEYHLEYQAQVAVTSLFTGSYKGTGYNNEELSSNADYGNAEIFAPDGDGAWIFTSGDYGTLTVNQSNS